MKDGLDALALGYSAAAVSALGMLALGVVGNLGIYMGAVAMMEEAHMFFSLSPAGIVGGMIEAGLIAFVFGYVFGLVYNRLA